jgi:hypothetical protein
MNFAINCTGRTGAGCSCQEADDALNIAAAFVSTRYGSFSANTAQSLPEKALFRIEGFRLRIWDSAADWRDLTESVIVTQPCLRFSRLVNVRSKWLANMQARLRCAGRSITSALSEELEKEPREANRLTDHVGIGEMLGLGKS